MKRSCFALLLAAACLCLAGLAHAEQAPNATVAPLSADQVAAALGLLAPDLGIPSPQPAAKCQPFDDCVTTCSECNVQCSTCSKISCTVNLRGCGSSFFLCVCQH